MEKLFWISHYVYDGNRLSLPILKQDGAVCYMMSIDCQMGFVSGIKIPGMGIKIPGMHFHYQNRKIH
jgi:hypothetical protein